MWAAILIPVLIVLFGVRWSIRTVNGFRAKEIRIEESLSGIEVALTKRYDLLTKLLDTARGYMTYEKELLSQVITLRQGMGLAELQDADKRMTALSGQVFAVAENYPRAALQ